MRNVNKSGVYIKVRCKYSDLEDNTKHKVNDA